MKKSTLYGIIWSGWLGFCLGWNNISFLDWKFWAIFIPIVIFTDLEKEAYKNEE